MQFLFPLFSLLTLATTSAMAQSANFGAPADMTQIQAGSNFTVMVDRPDSLTGSVEISLVIALLSCASSACPGPSAELGTVLYNGPFDPQFTTEPGTTTLPPHENFTLTVPSTFTKGNAQLGAAHFYLLGASVAPVLETFNTTIVVT